jgi:acyl-CoA thioesterase FadM
MPAPPLPDGVFRQIRTVGWRDVDETARVGPATLAAYAEDCGVAVAAAFGWPLERCSAAGFLMVLRRHEVEYGPHPGLGDELEIVTWASDRTRATAVRHYLLASPTGVVARFRSRYAWLDARSRRPMRIPEAFLADFTPNFVAAGE